MYFLKIGRKTTWAGTLGGEKYKFCGRVHIIIYPGYSARVAQ
ncbi:hypothetical protein CJA_3083 [Cellvibrio japonicus Ueda107]|uniref:Uncharacterized protein n=1 Tax=Cellvibrio japonicus (strain Ueda107) TaxID=498211 RepID=B3PDC5_CELJU|nr:hypothetical protein CJA_3083 [Cellvibrio japonicus Ueda107]